jgi:flagellar FliL protein
MAKEAPRTNAPAVPAEAAEASKKKGKARIIIILVAVLLILGAGAGGAYWWWFLRVPSSPGASAPQSENAGLQGKDSSSRVERISELPRTAGKVLPLPQFVVNLSDPAGKRVLRLGMEVEANADISKELQANDAKIRDAVITLLAGKSYAEVQSPEGKVQLRMEVAARLNLILGSPRIVRVYFTEFVVN